MVRDGANLMKGLPDVDVLAQRVVVIFSDYLSDLIVLDMIDRIDSAYDVALVLAGTLLAYSLADLTSGTIYLVLDKHRGNLPTRPSAPADMGAEKLLLAPVRGAKKLQLYETWKGDFFARCWQPCLWATPFLSVVAGWQPENLGLEALCVMYLSLLAIMPQLRQWSHAAAPPAPVRVLQRLGLLYRVPAGGTSGFCCINGWWNPVLDFLALVPLPARTRRDAKPAASPPTSEPRLIQQPRSPDSAKVSASLEVSFEAERIAATRVKQR